MTNLDCEKSERQTLKSFSLHILWINSFNLELYTAHEGMGLHSVYRVFSATLHLSLFFCSSMCSPWPQFLHKYPHSGTGSPQEARISAPPQNTACSSFDLAIPPMVYSVSCSFLFPSLSHAVFSPISEVFTEVPLFCWSQLCPPCIGSCKLYRAASGIYQQRTSAALLLHPPEAYTQCSFLIVLPSRSSFTVNTHTEV